jgi:hypothetical protein
MRFSQRWSQDIMPRGLLKVNGRFEGTCHNHLQDWRTRQARNQREAGSKQSNPLAKSLGKRRELQDNSLISCEWANGIFAQNTYHPFHAELSTHCFSYRPRQVYCCTWFEAFTVTVHKKVFLANQPCKCEVDVWRFREHLYLHHQGLINAGIHMANLTKVTLATVG